MNASKTLLRMQYARVISLFAEKANISMQEALDFFYHSVEYRLMREGAGNLHCMSDDYLAEELLEEWQGNGRYGTRVSK